MSPPLSSLLARWRAQALLWMKSLQVASAYPPAPARESPPASRQKSQTPTRAYETATKVRAQRSAPVQAQTVAACAACVSSSCTQRTAEVPRCWHIPPIDPPV
eukprot:231602-Prymnesium_polylepis.2